jgi:hypothetical protein
MDLKNPVSVFYLLLQSLTKRIYGLEHDSQILNSMEKNKKDYPALRRPVRHVLFSKGMNLPPIHFDFKKRVIPGALKYKRIRMVIIF